MIAQQHGRVYVIRVVSDLLSHFALCSVNGALTILCCAPGQAPLARVVLPVAALEQQQHPSGGTESDACGLDRSIARVPVSVSGSRLFLRAFARGVHVPVITPLKPATLMMNRHDASVNCLCNSVDFIRVTVRKGLEKEGIEAITWTQCR